ncbi:hypothetical protein [Bosea sp. NPDC055594]
MSAMLDRRHYLAQGRGIGAEFVCDHTPGRVTQLLEKSAIRAAVEYVFAHQKSRFGLFIRAIGRARAEAKLTLANIAYNFDRLTFHERAAARG